MCYSMYWQVKTEFHKLAMQPYLGMGNCRGRENLLHRVIFSRGVKIYRIRPNLPPWPITECWLGTPCPPINTTILVASFLTRSHLSLRRLLVVWIKHLPLLLGEAERRRAGRLRGQLLHQLVHLEQLGGGSNCWLPAALFTKRGGGNRLIDGLSARAHWFSSCFLDCFPPAQTASYRCINGHGEGGTYLPWPFKKLSLPLMNFYYCKYPLEDKSAYTRANFLPLVSQPTPTYGLLCFMPKLSRSPSVSINSAKDDKWPLCAM